MKRATIKLWLSIIATVTVSNFVSAQIVDQTGFEQFANGTAFTESSWGTAGFTVPWTNGFDQNRAIVDDSFAKSGTKSVRLFYPQGKYGTANTGGQAPLTVPPLEEYYASYAVRFSENFSWGTTSEGGKLPGLSGGDRCSGCNTCTGANGFTARLMWRNGGKAVVYLYHLNKNNPPCGDNYEIMLDGKNVIFEKGVWYKISQRVKVNTGSNKNGEVEMWINDRHAQLKLYNGTLVDKLTGIQFVSNGGKVDGLYFSTFHGGGDSGWAPVTDSYVWFDDIIISTRLSDVVNTVVTSFQSEFKPEEAEICFPNPFHKSITLNVMGNFEYGIYDYLGKEVESGIGEGSTEVGMHLKPGFYFVKTLNEKDTKTFKITKE